MATRRWFVLCVGCIVTTVLASQSPSPPAPAAPSAGPRSEGTAGAQRPDLPVDDEFIEFLGTDDVGDAAWWEFLKKSAPASELPRPAESPPDAKP